MNISQPRRLIAAVTVLLAGSLATACNIPVFRYALERWKSDDVEAIVFFRGEMSADHSKLLERLQSAAFVAGGTTNFNVLRCDLDANPPAELAAVFASLRESVGSELPLPHLTLRSRLPRSGLVNCWSSPLDATSVASVLESPARTELAKRLLDGDSVVWLMIRSDDETQNVVTRENLQTAFKSLRTKMTLPDGIGLPGSELFSDVPLLIQFGVLEIDAKDEKEKLLLQMLTHGKPIDEPLVIPVFGRGRALEVLPSSDASVALIEDLTMFLGAACSCQVKEQNPGFDLLLSVDWNTELFGEGGLSPAPSSGNGNPDKRPVLLSIPPGRK